MGGFELFLGRIKTVFGTERDINLEKKKAENLEKWGKKEGGMWGKNENNLLINYRNFRENFEKKRGGA